MSRATDVAEAAHSAGVVLLALALLCLIGAPVGVMLGQAVLEMGVVAIAGVGLALLHLTVVLAVQGRSIALELRRGVGR